MDIKSNSAMIIALAIAVVVVTGVMVPVISDTIDNAGGADNGGGNNDNDSETTSVTYTNTGDYYFKEPVANDDTTIRINNNENDVTVYRNGTLLYTLAKGTDWILPISIYIDQYEGKGYSCHYLSHHIDEYSEYDLFYDEDYIEQNGYVLMEADGSMVAVSICVEDGTPWNTYEYSYIGLISDTGEWVYADSPTVLPDSQMILFSKESIFKQVEVTYNDEPYETKDAVYSYNFIKGVSYWTWQQHAGEQQENYDDCYLHYIEDGYQVDELLGMYMTYTLDVTEVEGAIKVNGITLSERFEDYSGYATTVSDSFTRLIVPTTIVSSLEENANYGDYKYKRAVSGFSTDLYLLSNGTRMTTDIDDPSKEWNTGAMVQAPIVIAKDCVIIEYSGDIRILDSQGSWRITDHLTINGTTLTAYRDGGGEMTVNDVLLFSWESGEYVLNWGPTMNDSPYPIHLEEGEWFASYMEYGTQEDDSTTWEWYAIVFGTPNSNTVSLIPDEYGGQPPSTYEDSAEITMDGTTVTEITVNVDNEDYVFIPDTNGQGRVVYAFVPSGAEENDSGGSGLSPTLVTLLTTVPLVVIAGIILVGVGMLRGKT